MKMARLKLITISVLLIVLFFCFIRISSLRRHNTVTYSNKLKRDSSASGFPQPRLQKKSKPVHQIHKDVPIKLKGAHDLVIKNKDIQGGSAPCITLIDCYNIKIINNTIANSSEPGISLYNCSNIVVERNFFSKLSTGIYAENSDAGGIVVRHNSFLNMLGPFPRGQCIQFNNINGPGNSISYNKCKNIAGESYPEDAISLYKSNGTPDSPIIIESNQIKGGGPSKSGGGIMLGDSGGSNQTAINNILVDPGQYGIAISGGNNNSIIGNYIYGRAQQFTNVGVYVAGYNGQVCTNSTVKLNMVNFHNYLGKANNSWIGPNTLIPSGWSSNFWGANINSGILPY